MTKMSFLRHHSLVFELIKREFSRKYRGSIVGITWSVAQPLVLLMVYTVAFGLILKARWGFSGSTREYALILFIGLIVLNAFSEVLNRSPTLITENQNFVKKVVFPLELLPVVMVVTALLHALIGIAIWFAGYFLIVGVPQSTALMFPLIVVCFVPVLLGVGWLLSSVGVAFKDSSQLAGILSHALLFLTPIFYSLEAAPPHLQKILMFNPLTFVIEQLRLVLIFGQLPSLNGLVIYFGFACVFAVISLKIFQRLRVSFADML
jgi:lipopolysaccharide transport system permease protein